MRPAQAACLLLLSAAAGCARPATTAQGGEATLRIAISTGRMSLSAPEAGLAQVRQNLSLESLASFGDDGTPRPSVAEGWNVSADQRVVTVRLRTNVQYQDGTPVTVEDIAGILKRALPRAMGSAFEDIDDVRATGDREVAIRFRRPSGFRLELLEVPVQKPANPAISTGPYAPVPGKKDELRANDNYYLGRPNIQRVLIESYPSFRSAWADMLRGRNDMLYEVGVDALDSLQKAANVAHVFTFPKRYQYVIVLNTKSSSLKAAPVRQALNLAIDRTALIRDALSGHGEPSIGPVNSRQWAIAGRDVPKFEFSAQKAAGLIRGTGEPVRFTCLVLADYERLALVAKQQLQAVGVDMALEEVAADELLKRVAAHDFDAFLVDVVSGPTMYRLYRFWHSGQTLNPTGLGTPSIDAALDEIRHAGSDEDYRQAVVGFLQAIVDDPPAIFLAWSEGARAVSRRFDAATDPDRPDPISNLRLWRPANAAAAASRN